MVHSICDSYPKYRSYNSAEKVGAFNAPPPSKSRDIRHIPMMSRMPPPAGRVCFGGLRVLLRMRRVSAPLLPGPPAARQKCLLLSILIGIFHRFLFHLFVLDMDALSWFTGDWFLLWHPIHVFFILIHPDRTQVGILVDVLLSDEVDEPFIILELSKLVWSFPLRWDPRCGRYDAYEGSSLYSLYS